MFDRLPPTSRYYQIEVATYTDKDGREIAYLRRRFVPSAARFALLSEHVVSDGERPDTLAARYLGDPEQFWRLADANNVLRPQELTDVIGEHVRITLPEGVEGVTGD